MAYGEAKVYYDGSHYIAIPHTERPQKPRRNKVEKEIVINEKNEVVPEFDEKASTITTKKGQVLEEVEFVKGKLKPVVEKVKSKGVRTSKKALFERLYEENMGLKKKDRRQKIIDGIKEINGLFKTDDDLIRYVDIQLERKQRNLILLDFVLPSRIPFLRSLCQAMQPLIHTTRIITDKLGKRVNVAIIPPCAVLGDKLGKFLVIL